MTTPGSDAIYVATKYRQGGRMHYNLQIPISQILRIVPKPNPDRPEDGNRAVNLKHAESFGLYLRENSNWVSPAVMLRAAPGDIRETGEPVESDSQRTSLVNVMLPPKVTDELAALRILDGQHRTFGIYDAYEGLLAEREESHRVARLADEQDRLEVASRARDRASQLDDVLRRFVEECISIDIAVVEDRDAHQMFVDIADNAKGISRDFRVVLDQRSVSNRIATHLMEHHSLLKNRSWDGQTGRMPTKAPFLWGAKSIADMTRVALKGPGGRVGRNDEHEFSSREEHYTRQVGQFFDDLTEGFESLAAVEKGTIEPQALRDIVGRGETQALGPHFSMIYSETMLRALAGAWYELQHPSMPRAGKGKNKDQAAQEPAKPMTRQQIVEFFRRLEPLMRLTEPIGPTSVWTRQTDAFLPGTTAPQARQGTINDLTSKLVLWARSGKELTP
jgi:hypothetical protein